MTGLQPDTSYHYRLYATSGGKAIEGKDGEFTTTAFVSTLAASKVGEESATLEGRAYFPALGLPTNPKTTYEFEYGTTKSYGTKVAAGGSSGTNTVSFYANLAKLARTTIYHYRAVAKNEYGTFYGRDQSFRTAGWVGQSLAKAFKETEGPDDVECPTTTRCIGVEGGHKKETSNTYAWNGENWSVQTIPAEKYPQDLSCASTAACMTVGASLSGAYAAWWDGKSWTDISPSLPPEFGGGYLEGVSCPAVNKCFAVGQGWIPNQESPEYLLYRWDGKSWYALAVPTVSPHLNPFATLFTDISCPSTSECLAMGWAPLRWNGTSWSQVKTPSGFGQYGHVSCVAGSSCVAVNYYGTYSKASINAAMQWNGEEWTSLPAPGEISASGYQEARVTSIWCPEVNFCSAVGWIEHLELGYVETSEPTAIHWDGSGWSNEYVEAAVSKPPAYHKAQSVSCASTGFCMAVGDNSALGYVGYGIYPLVMTYNYAAPSAVTDAVTPVGSGSVQLHAAVNPNAYSTSYQFEYGETSTFGAKAPASPESIGAGRQNVQVSQTVALPEQGASIHFRVAGTNEEGTSYGEELATPSASTLVASSVGTSQATLKGSVNPQSFSTSYQFEYVESAAYKPEAENPYSSRNQGSG